MPCVSELRNLPIPNLGEGVPGEGAILISPRPLPQLRVSVDLSVRFSSVFLKKIAGRNTTISSKHEKGVEKGVEKNKRGLTINVLPLLFVGMTRFELATPRPPDAYSNRTELHPELCFSQGKAPFFRKAMQNYCFSLNCASFFADFF